MATNGQPGEGLRIQVGEHIYITPPVPPKENMLFHSLKKKDQYWRRQTDLPEIFYAWHEGVEIDAESSDKNDDGTINALSKAETDTLFYFQEREMERRRNGVWFLNNGEPTYITGDHYFALQWGAMLGCDNKVEVGSKYGQYYKFQAEDIFYFFEICEQTKFGLGGLLVKPKKTGATQAIALILLNRATMMEQKIIRMMSITEDICKDINFNFVTYALSKMPNILVPSRSKQNLGEVKFGSPNSARNPLKKSRNVNAVYLETRLSTTATANNGFDGATNFIGWIDEFPKIKGNASPKELFPITMAAVRQGSERKGTVFASSYVPEYNDDSFYESKTIYWDSKLSTIAEGKKSTASKLICHTLTVQKGIFGCCDKYGSPILDEVWKTINEDIADCKGDEKKIQALKRQYPTNETDPWLEGMGMDMLFRNLAFDRQRQDISIMQARGLRMYEEFNLGFMIPPTMDDIKQEYKFPGQIRYEQISDDQIRSGKHSKFKWFKKEWIPEAYIYKNVNCCRVNKKNGKLEPNQNSPFYGVIDPANYTISRNVAVGSKNALQIILLPDSEIDAFCGVRNASFKRTMVSYLYREEKPSNTLLDVVAAMLYFSCYFLIESNTPWLFNRLIEMGFENFLIVRNVVTQVFEPHDMYKMTSGEQKMYSSQKTEGTNDIDYYTKAAKDYYGEPDTIDDPDNIKLEYDIDIIDQAIRFKKEDTRPFDAAVCRFTGIMGVNHFLGWRQKQGNRKIMLHEGMQELFKRMDDF